MIVKSFIDNPSIKNDVEPLFLSAFPEDERPPAKRYFSLFKKKSNILYGFYEGKNFIGFASVTIYKDIAYIFFLAVTLENRNKGYGSAILSYIKNEYQNYTVLLCYEEVDDKYPDNDLRKKREEFYIRNGFIRNPFKSDEFNVVYQSAYYGSHEVSFEEYQEIFKMGFGSFAVKFLRKYQ